MKISNSKKQLAQIIHENVGWVDGYDFSAQDGDDCAVWFYDGRPVPGSGRWWKAYGRAHRGIEGVGKLPNWHQTILSRNEYFHLYPAPDADGWIEWKGGSSPVSDFDRVDIKLRMGEVWLDRDSRWRWSHDGHETDIIAYRLHKPEQQLGELCDKVTEENKHEHVDAKPTIEQLAADYRNLKDFAYRKQEEADDAKADADEALRKLELAGEEIGLIVTPITAKQESELVITDWRDLQVGDIIEYADGYIKDKIGMTGPVVELAPDAEDGMPVRMRCDNGQNKGRLGWPRKWRFIRRP